MTKQVYFSVEHDLSINIEPLPEQFELPNDEDFIREIPAPFLIASEFPSLEHLLDNKIAHVSHHELRAVIECIGQQEKKINLLFSYMLEQQNDNAFRHTTTSFGASQLSYIASTALPLQQLVRVKIFLESQYGAVYCYACVSQCNQTANDQFDITVEYQCIRPEDQDALIRAALHLQQKQLRQRSHERKRDK